MSDNILKTFSLALGGAGSPVPLPIPERVFQVFFQSDDGNELIVKSPSGASEGVTLKAGQAFDSGYLPEVLANVDITVDGIGTISGGYVV